MSVSNELLSGSSASKEDSRRTGYKYEEDDQSHRSTTCLNSTVSGSFGAILCSSVRGGLLSSGSSVGSGSYGGGRYSSGSQCGSLSSGGRYGGRLSSGGRYGGRLSSGGLYSSRLNGGGLYSSRLNGGGLYSGGLNGGGLYSCGFNSCGLNGGGLYSGGLNGGGLYSCGLSSCRLSSCRLSSCRLRTITVVKKEISESCANSGLTGLNSGEGHNDEVIGGLYVVTVLDVRSVSLDAAGNSGVDHSTVNNLGHLYVSEGQNSRIVLSNPLEALNSEYNIIYIGGVELELQSNKLRAWC